MRNKKRIKYYLEYALLLTFKAVLSILPERTAYNLMKILGSLIYRFFPIRRDVVHKNLKVAFGENLSEKRLKEIALSSYKNAAIQFAEFSLMEKWSREKIINLFDEFEGKQYLEKYAGRENTWIGLSAHIGNWEMLAAYFAAQGQNVLVVAKPIHNPFVNRWTERVRSACGYNVVYTNGDVRKMLKHLKGQGVLAFLADQDARKAGVFVDFFGKPASTALGPATFAYRTDTPIVPAFDIRKSNGKHKIVCLSPIFSPKNLTKDEALLWLTKQHVKAVEEIARAYPEQYFWFHRRWKTQPPQYR